VLGLVARDGVRLVSLGVVVGLLLAAGATRLLTGLLFGLSPLDGVTFAVMSALFVAVALVASYLPARRAAASDPDGGAARGVIVAGARSSSST
jgi:putative ABC transport system permease protein